MLKDMPSKAKAALKRLHLWRVSRHAGLRAAAAGKNLAPGTLKMLSDAVTADQMFFSREAEKHGPIFKVWWTNKLTTCIVGHELGRRFLSANEGKIRAATIDLTPLFPHGFLRAMEGETHRKYRRMFIDAFRATPLSDHDDEIRSIVRDALAAIASDGVGDAASIRARLKSATSAISLRLILGIERSTPAFRELAAAYESYAPDAPFLVVENRHRAAYAVLRQHVAELVGSRERLDRAPTSILKALVMADQMDDTVVGNLIQMTEASLYDMHGLWMWILHMLSVNPKIAKRMAGLTAVSITRDYATAIAQEALRMEQSEFIHRIAEADIVFEGHFIPKNSRIRICVWDGHRDSTKFPDPSTFDPDRFLNAKPDIDTYSPFGLDKHRCLGADWTVELAATYVEELVHKYRLELLQTGPTERGKFHFEPSSRFQVLLDSTH
jgi:cytochrome P450